METQDKLSNIGQEYKKF